MYKSYVRPIAEYGDIMFSNMTKEQSLLIENVNKMTGKIISGATVWTRTSIIYDELERVSMETRRKPRRIFTFHKIIHVRSPPYLRNSSPPYNRERSTRALRNSDDLTTIHARLSVFYKSYFPQTVREWNTLSVDIRQIEEPESLKRALTESNPTSKLLFYHGKRKFNSIHSRMGMGCSKHKAHLFQHHVVDSPACLCGNPYEDPFHYFLGCPRYINQRDTMINAISAITPCKIRTILYGCEVFSLEENKMVFNHVHGYMRSSKRVWWNGCPRWLTVVE